MKSAYLKNLVCLTVFISFFAAPSFAQLDSNAALMFVGNEKVTVKDFLTVFKKNNNRDGSAIDRKSLEEYLDLYTIFRLKVKEAKEMGVDTSKSFRDELGGYRKTLAQPYMTDTSASNGLIREAYQRMKWDIRSSHILVKMEADEDTIDAYAKILFIKDFLSGKGNASAFKKYETMVKANLKISKTSPPKDTLAAYAKLNPLKEMMKLKARDFASVAKVVSDHPSKSNGGDLGYMTGLTQGFPYEYENAVFNAKQGTVYGPFRTSMGYHLVLVVDKREHRELKVAHLMLLFKKGMQKADSVNMKMKIDSISGAINKGGAKFEDMVTKFSDHKETIKKGGDLGWMAPGSNFPPEFKDAAFALKANGVVTNPIQTRFGWHIVRRLEERTLPAFDTIKSDLKTRVQKDLRSGVAKEVMIGKIKAKYKFTETMPKNYSDFYAVVDSSIWLGQWKSDKAKSLTKPMFTILDKTYTQQDFAKYVEKNYRTAGRGSVRKMVDALYKPFVDEICLNLREANLENEYRDFKALMNEYSDGILLFNLMDMKVWSRAIKDTSGAKAYHEKNKDKFLWDERLDASIYTCKDEKTAEKVRKMLKANKSDKEIASAMNIDTMITVSIDGKTMFLKGENALLDATGWTPGITANQTVKNKIVIANIRRIMKPTPKTYIEARGLVTSEYQSFLEKEWIASLKMKYPVSIDRKVFDSIK